MNKTRQETAHVATIWWHLAWALVLAGLTAYVVLDDNLSQTRTLNSLVSLAVIALAWFGLGWRCTQDGVLKYVFQPVLIIALGFSIAYAPTAAMLQALVYPTVWILAGKLSEAIAANILVAISVALGFFFGLGQESPYIALAIGAFSFLFSLGLGLWITRIDAWGAERDRLLTELQAKQEQLENLHRDAGVTAERERIARELHDTIAQDLTAIIMLAQRNRAGNRTAATDFMTIEQTAKNALAETRALVAAGSPPGMESISFSAALSRLVDRFNRESDTSFDLELEAEIDISRETEVVLYRCLQEGLANARKHAKAKRVQVLLRQAAQSIQLLITDDGVGITQQDSSGVGLQNVRKRLEIVGGSLTISKAQPSGTRLIIEVPL